MECCCFTHAREDGEEEEEEEQGRECQSRKDKDSSITYLGNTQPAFVSNTNCCCRAVIGLRSTASARVATATRFRSSECRWMELWEEV
jgi:hypothetical protein